jgi:hypothetical protein
MVRLRLAYLLAWTVATALVAGVSLVSVWSVLAVRERMRPASADVADRAVPAGVAPTPRRSTKPAPTRPASPAAPGPSWTSVPNGRGGTAYRRSFRTNGGDMAVYVEPGVARVLETSPKAGYAVNIKRLGDDAVEVSFTRDRQLSRILVRWLDAPYAELTESVA